MRQTSYENYFEMYAETFMADGTDRNEVELVQGTLLRRVVVGASVSHGRAEATQRLVSWLAAVRLLYGRRCGLKIDEGAMSGRVGLTSGAHFLVSA